MLATALILCCVLWNSTKTLGTTHADHAPWPGRALLPSTLPPCAPRPFHAPLPCPVPLPQFQPHTTPSALAFIQRHTRPGKQPETCGDRFGLHLIQRWRARQADYCTPQQEQRQGHLQAPLAGQALPPSLMQCQLLQEPHAENLCDVRNIAVDLDAMDRPSGIAWKGSDNSLPAGYVPPPQAMHLAHCPVDPKLFVPAHFGNAAQGFLHSAQPNSPDPPPVCDVVVNHTLLMLARYDVHNYFHLHEDAINTFTAMAVLELDPVDTEVVHALIRLWPSPHDATNAPAAPAATADTQSALTAATLTQTPFAQPSPSGIVWVGLVGAQPRHIRAVCICAVTHWSTRSCTHFNHPRTQSFTLTLQSLIHPPLGTKQTILYMCGNKCRESVAARAVPTRQSADKPRRPQRDDREVRLADR